MTDRLFPDHSGDAEARSSLEAEPLPGAPLADRMRPRSLDEFEGQEGVIGPGTILRRSIENDDLRSVIFWGLITFIQNLGRQMVDAGLIPTSIMDTSQVDQIRFWIVGAALALLMIFRPQGILGSKEEMALDAH